jgi:carboxylesterase type B
MGLKEQPAALHWVMKNTEAFGGNPDIVSLIQILLEEPV